MSVVAFHSIPAFNTVDGIQVQSVDLRAVLSRDNERRGGLSA
jgi:hypothetical protein